MSDLVNRLRSDAALDKLNGSRLEAGLSSEAADRIEALESALRQAGSCLDWYVKNDDVLEGGRWEVENAFWLAGKRDSEAVIAGIYKLLAKEKPSVEG